MPGESSVVDKATLFARLAEGHAAGITVVTPNNRLAAALRAEFDDFQVNKKLTVWEDADLLPLESFAERSYEESLYADPAGGQPQLLSVAQEQALWESVVARAGLFAVAETAVECAKAWKLAHQWRIEGALSLAGNEDTKTFARWAAEYARRCDKESWTDRARLPDRKRGLFEKKPKLLVAYGFDVVPAQTREFFAGFDCVFCAPEKRKADPVKTSHPSARHELDAAARWARGRIEQGAKRVGLVVPRLEQRRREVLRVFARAGVPVDVSLGEPLASYPIVDFSLSLFEFVFKDLEYETLSRLIRSPFLGGGESEFAARARLDAKLRRRISYRVSLPKLIAETSGSLRVLLEKIFRLGKENQHKTQNTHDWAQVFTSLLEAAGFPGERTLDSAEYQARVRFNELLGEFSRLTLVSGKILGEKALQTLKGLCSRTLFQPERPQAPVSALGILESAGLEFDALWVSGLTEEAWPLAARPNPFLPLAAQRRAGIPQASAEASLAFDQRITEGWAGAANEVVFSSYEKEEDRELLTSPLIAAIPEGKVEVPPFASFQELIFQGRKTEAIQDEKAPPVPAPTIAGGTRVLADQSACPFRAFARYRLGARELDAPAPGLDARGRGSLLHALMAEIWKQLGSSSSLSKDLKPVIRKAASAAVKQLGIEGKFAELEQERLAKLAREWLEIEKLREPFEVVAIEREAMLKVGNLELKGRIDRLDRLADGKHAVIDYKTGERVNPDDWMGTRPREPQLPVYAVSTAEPIGAVAFARLRTGKMRFAGFSRAKGVIPQVNAAKSWPGLVEGWKKEIERLAGQFEAGDARVDPRDLAKTCRTCDLQPLCRVHERLSLDVEIEEGE